MIAPLKVLLSASARLKILTKVRCVESYSFGSEVRYKVIRPWPSNNDKYKEIENWCKSNGIKPNEKLRVQAYPVNYSEYENYRRISATGIEAIKAERNVITSAIIATQKEDVEKIACIWDVKKDPNRIYPLKTDNFEELKKFSSNSDSMLGFKTKGNQFYYKIQAFVGLFVFEELGLFRNTHITPEDISNSSGEKTDHMNRADRFIVKRQNIGYLESVFGNSLKSMQGIVTEKWADSLRAASISRYKETKS